MGGILGKELLFFPQSLFGSAKVFRTLFFLYFYEAFFDSVLTVQTNGIVKMLKIYVG